MKRYFWVLFLLSALLMGRQPPTENIKDETACIKKGGKWHGTQVGRGRITGCNLPTTDGGKACKFSEECQSFCVRYECWGWSQYRGCGILVKENGQTKNICEE